MRGFSTVMEVIQPMQRCKTVCQTFEVNVPLFYTLSHCSHYTFFKVIWRRGYHYLPLIPQLKQQHNQNYYVTLSLRLCHWWFWLCCFLGTLRHIMDSCINCDIQPIWGSNQLTLTLTKIINPHSHTSPSQGS